MAALAEKAGEVAALEGALAEASAAGQALRSECEGARLAAARAGQARERLENDLRDAHARVDTSAEALRAELRRVRADGLLTPALSRSQLSPAPFPISG